MIILKDKKRREKYINTFLFGMALLIVLCIVGLFCTQKWYNRTLEESAERQNQTILQLTATTIDGYLSQTLSSAKLITYNTSFYNFINQGPIEEGSQDIEVILQVKNQLPSSQSLNPLLVEEYLYSQKNGCLISHSNAFLNPEKFYQLFAFEGLNYYQWKTKYLDFKGNSSFFPALTANVNGTSQKVIPYILTYPLSNPSADKGKIIQLLDANLFDQMLTKLNIGRTGWYRIIDKNDNIIVSHNSNDEFYDLDTNGVQTILGKDGKQYLVSTYKSNFSSLRYIAAIPKNEILQKRSPIQFFLIVIIVFTLILCFVYLFYFAYTRQKSWDHLLQTIHIKGSKKVSYETMNTLINLTIEQEKKQIKLDGNIRYITDIVLRRLINGKPLTEEMIAYAMSDFHFQENTQFIMARIKLFGVEHLINLDDINFSRIVAENEAKSKIKHNYYIYMDLEYNFWFILWDENVLNQRNLLYKFYESFKSMCPFNSVMAISSSFESLNNFVTASKQCNQVIYRMINNKEIYHIKTYDDFNTNNDLFSYTKKDEKILLTAVEKRDALLVKNLFDELYKKNYLDKNLSLNSENTLIESLNTTAIQYVYVHNFKRFPQKFKTFFDAKNYFIRVASTEKTKNTQNQELIENIKNYIKDNYRDVNLNLAMMAQSFQLKENYLYHFMAVQMKKTFAQYLEAYRLEQALILIKSDKSMTINKVSKDCGYANPQTFRRAFKKYFNKLPSHFK